MSLQKGNVEVNGTLGKPPQPTISVEEFRALFTEEHRAFLAKAVECLRLDSLKRYHALFQQGLIAEDDVLRMAQDDAYIGREALQLIFKIHPPPYEW